MKHTAGQWKAKFSINKELPFEIYNSSENTTLAFVTSFNKSGSTEANAKLIAAAPKLLEACKEAESTIDLLMNNPKKFVSQASCKMSLSKILAAIKAATE